MICGWHIANSFIKKSLDEKIYINSSKLNYLVYLLYSDYLYLTGEKLFNELFIKTNKGPILPTIEFKFGCFKNNVITKYAKTAKDEVLVLSSELFDERLVYIWDKYKNSSDVEILQFINDTSLINKKQDNEIISDNEILTDQIKRKEIKVKKFVHNNKF